VIPPKKALNKELRAVALAIRRRLTGRTMLCVACILLMGIYVLNISRPIAGVELDRVKLPEGVNFVTERIAPEQLLTSLQESPNCVFLQNSLQKVYNEASHVRLFLFTLLFVEVFFIAIFFLFSSRGNVRKLWRVHRRKKVTSGFHEKMERCIQIIASEEYYRMKVEERKNDSFVERRGYDTEPERELFINSVVYAQWKGQEEARSKCYGKMLLDPILVSAQFGQCLFLTVVQFLMLLVFGFFFAVSIDYFTYGVDYYKIQIELPNNGGEAFCAFPDSCIKYFSVFEP